MTSNRDLHDVIVTMTVGIVALSKNLLVLFIAHLWIVQPIQHNTIFNPRQNGMLFFRTVAERDGGELDPLRLRQFRGSTAGMRSVLKISPF